MINKIVLPVIGVFAALIVSLLWILLGLTVSGISLTISFTIVYFFLAAAGFVPPQDFIPFVPYV